LVDRPPDRHPLAEGTSRPFREPRQPVDDARVLPAALACDPQRVREVMERRRRRHPMAADGVADGAVVVELALLEAPFLRLDAAPLDRETLRGVAELGGEPEVV